VFGADRICTTGIVLYEIQSKIKKKQAERE
jgi:hypothetical protein